MRARLSLLVLTLSFAMGALPAAAQRRNAPPRVPSTGMNAFGASIGFTAPSDLSLTDGLTLGGSIEHYLTPRASIRGEVGGSRWQTTGRGFQADLTPVYFDGNLVYNWEGGVWHSYVTGGAGLYHYGFSAPPLGRSVNKLGVNAGGGLEYFVTGRTTLFGDARYHAVPDINPLVNLQSSFWRVSAGFKRYY